MLNTHYLLYYYLVLAYVCGSVPYGLLAGKMIKGIDIRDYGSGNIGASNVWRTLGPTAAIVVFILDVGKGFIPVIAFKMMGHYWQWSPMLIGLAAYFGHNYSPFLKFKGGKGVATSLGVAVAFSWQAGLIGFAVWALCLAITRYISVSSMVATPIASVSIWYFNHYQIPYALFGVLATVFVIVKHKSNMERLRKGTEPKVGEKKKKTEDEEATSE